ncbi:Carboxypeptidase A2 [Halotydeus destructor]|nr:Carboxypeptidase A2 [Halotydeus destructor]
MLAYFSLFCLVHCATCLSYENYSVIRVPLDSEDDIPVIRNLSSSFQLWSERLIVGQYVIGHVHNEVRDQLITNFAARNLNASIISSNMEYMIDLQKLSPNLMDNLFSEERSPFSYERYNRLPWIYEQLKTLAAKFEKFMQLTNIGQTFEERDMYVLKIGHGDDHVVIECGAHAREWISPATCLWVVKQLTELEPANDLLDKFSFHILPVLNPDGYRYTWHKDRHWRKNRAYMGIDNDKCHGVDLNRNFDAAFNTFNTQDQTNPCHPLHAGKKPFSELETTAWRDHLLSLPGKYGGTIVAYFALHNYQQLWMHPYAYKSEYPEGYDHLDRIAKMAVQEIKDFSGVVYKPGTMHDAIYKATGTSVDWVHDAISPILSYTVELRDRGQQGFLLMPKFIRPTGQEFWVGLKRCLCELKNIKR